MNDTAIKVTSVYKAFKLPHEKTTTIKSALINFHRRKRGYERQHVLDDVSFTVNKGEFFGIVGRNGSGKSTLLKLLAGIYTPNKGEIQISGSLAPFIELGVGFNPELTGRENVFLNGALLGFSHNEMERMYSDIVEFAELSRFMDQKLKNYSSGMQIRLAFSIAIKAEADIILLDEVLAVGDANFQKKCFDYFRQVKKENKTVVLVTHDMNSVERFCDRVLLLDKGKILDIGSAQSVAKKYSDLNLISVGHALKKKENQEPIKENDEFTISVGVYSNGEKTKIIRPDDEFALELEIQSKKVIKKAVLGIIVFNATGVPVFATNTKVSEVPITIEPQKKLQLHLAVDNIFSNGEYTVSLSIRNEDATVIYYTEEESARFVAGGRRHEYAVASPAYTISLKK